MELQDYEQELIGYSVEITRWLVAKGIPLVEAQDTVQDVFVKMLELDVLIPPSKLRSWMYRVSLNTYINHYHRQQKYQVILESLKHELSSLAEKPPDLRPFIARLKSTDQTLLLAYYFHQRSVKEIAEITGYTQSKVKTRLYRARKKLKKILESEGYDEWKI